MSVNVADLVQQMLAAAKATMKPEEWRKTAASAEEAFRKIASDIAYIESRRIAGDMTDEEARIHLDMQKNAARTVLLSLEGMGLLAVEQAINAALAAVKDTVNRVVGFVLIA